MTTTPFACWIDIETTGLSVDADILEVGLRTTDTDFNTIAEASWVTPYSEGRIADLRTLANPVVRDMHDASGLWVECGTLLAGAGRLRAVLRQDVLAWMTEHAKGLPVAGSTIRTDRGWLSHWIPESDQILHYRSIDVSSLWLLAEARRPDVVADAPVAQKRHRVMPDLDDSIALLRYLCDALGIGPVAA